MTQPDPHSPPSRSREAAEAVALLHALDATPHDVGALTARLGLAAALAPAVGEAIATLAHRGLVEVAPGRVVPSPTGRALLAAAGVPDGHG